MYLSDSRATGQEAVINDNAIVSGNAPADLLLAGAVGPDGRPVEVTVRDGWIEAVGPQGSLPAAATRLDLTGSLLLPAPAEPHAHLDKALTSGRMHNTTGCLGGAAQSWVRYRPAITRADTVRRATAAARLLLSHGATAIRTHVDVGTDIGTRAVEALVAVREALRGQLTLQIVALPDVPLTGAAGAGQRAVLRDAMQAGADVVGGSPHLDPDPAGCQERCLALAAELGKPVDLHMDETTDPAVRWLGRLADLVAATGFPYRVTASHCVSLGTQPRRLVEQVAEKLAGAGIGVVCCPQTGLYLQGRDHHVAPPRGIAALAALLAAGVTVAGGGDNLQDPFQPLGRGDPLEIAALLVTAGHLGLGQAYAAVSAGARAVMGLPPVRIEPGHPADLLAIQPDALGGPVGDRLPAGEAVADAVAALACVSAGRLVFSAGNLVSRTALVREFAHSVPAVIADTDNTHA